MIGIAPIAEAHLADVQTRASHPASGATSNVPSPIPQNGAAQWFQVVTARIAAGRSQVFAASLDQAFPDAEFIDTLRKRVAASMDTIIN